MRHRVVLVHATINAVQPLVDAFSALEPDTELVHVVDEGLLLAVNEQGGVTPQILASFTALLRRAMDNRADGILLSCSAFSPYVPRLAGKFPVPIVSVDGPMLEQAVSAGERIGIVATTAAAGPTTAGQVRMLAEALGKKVSIAVEVVTEAFDELKQGRGDVHDAFVRDRAMKLTERSDVIVLAQISMARAAKALAGLPIPVLTSPESSVKSIMSQLLKGGGTG